MKHEKSFFSRFCYLRSYRLFFSILCIATCSIVSAETFYVAPDGSDSNSGTITEPFGSLEKGADEAQAGDTVFIRGGTFNMSKGIRITKKGASDKKRICFVAYKTERPVFDFSEITTQTDGVTIGNSDWLYFKGIEFCNVPQYNAGTPCCVLVNRSAHINFELCEFHHNGGTGLALLYGTGGHFVLNCDSHDNYDPLSGQGDGQNADGFGIHYQNAATDTTIISGCRGWWNSDDGIDCIHQNTAVIFENSWFWLNGYKPGKMERPLAGNGQGIKAGGYDLPPNKLPAEFPQNIVRNCVSFLNGDRGLNANYHPVACKWYNNTSFGNKGGNVFMQGITISGGSNYTRVDKAILRNNISFNGIVRNCDGSGIDASNNSWDISGFNISEDDFVSIDTAGVFGPRKQDGSLPDIDFMKPAKGSRLIDAGEDVGLPFNGNAPDLGAFEYWDPSGNAVPFNPGHKKPAVLPTLSTYTSGALLDLSGRILSQTKGVRSCQLLVHDKTGTSGANRTSTVLHLR